MIPDPHRNPRTAFFASPAFGAAFWILFSIKIVLVRGPRWDEHYELAQVVLGNVLYPADHPLTIWTHNLPNLQILLSAAIVRIFPAPEIICTVRNALWLIALLIPVYLIAQTLAKRALAGHAAALFALFGIHQTFDAHYPMFAWPGYYSNGHIGGGLALFILWALLENRLRLAIFLIAFMPAIHITQMVPVALSGAAIGAMLLTRAESRGHVLKALPFALPGIVVSLTLFGLANANPAPLPESGPYFSPEPAAQVVRGFLKNDALRAMPGTVIPITGANLILALALFLVEGRLALERNSIGAKPWRRIALYLAITAGIVWGTMLLHLLLGEKIPSIFLQWMPYRFTNHAAILLLAILPATLLGNSEKRLGALAIGAALIFETVKPVLEPILGEILYARYVAEGDLTLFALSGAAAASIAHQLAGARRKKAWLALCAIGILALIPFHQFAVAGMGAGFALMIGAIRFQAPDRATSPLPWLAAAAALLSISIHQARAREPLYQSDFDRDVIAYFNEIGEPGAMIAARPDQRTLQARLDHPVFMDEALATGIPYVPTLAPSIQKMSRDLYGIRYHPEMTSGDPAWTALWQSRTPEQWRESASPYGIDYIISPNTVRLTLPKLIEGPVETLYKIPPG